MVWFLGKDFCYSVQLYVYDNGQTLRCECCNESKKTLYCSRGVHILSNN